YHDNVGVWSVRMSSWNHLWVWPEHGADFGCLSAAVRPHGLGRSVNDDRELETPEDEPSLGAPEAAAAGSANARRDRKRERAGGPGVGQKEDGRRRGGLPTRQEIGPLTKPLFLVCRTHPSLKGRRAISHYRYPKR